MISPMCRVDADLARKAQMRPIEPAEVAAHHARWPWWPPPALGGPAGSRLRGVDRDVPSRLDALSLERGDAFTFVTDAGDLDILDHPAGSGGYDALARNAAAMDLDSLQVLVASLDDLIAMKRASGRARDLAHLEVLGALREEIDRRG
jgi:hypothetical protein